MVIMMLNPEVHASRAGGAKRQWGHFDVSGRYDVTHFNCDLVLFAPTGYDMTDRVVITTPYVRCIPELCGIDARD